MGRHGKWLCFHGESPGLQPWLRGDLCSLISLVQLRVISILYPLELRLLWEVKLSHLHALVRSWLEKLEDGEMSLFVFLSEEEDKQLGFSVRSLLYL